jgi:hypothetical protein
LNEENFHKKFTGSLSSLESELEVETAENHLNIFVMGLPRSGTTLLTQLLYKNTDLYCTNNLIARFWKTPLVGAQLSKYTVSENPSDHYQSDYGRTSEIDHPHEFSWFWHDLLAVQGVDQYEPEKASSSIDWKKIRTKIINLNAILEGGLVFKPMELLGFHLPRFAELFKRALFVYVRRDPMDVALSISKARQAHGCGEDSWWGSYPPKAIYDKLKQKREALQVAHQVLYFKSLYEKMLALVSNEQVLQTNYESVCAHPSGFLEQVKDRADQIGGNLAVTHAPQPFSPRPKKSEESLLDGLREAFAEAEREITEAPDLNP